MHVHITIDRRTSLRQLTDRLAAGEAVHKTPHVGNLDTSELAVGSLGIPLLLVDATVGAKDFIYHPHCVIRGGERERLGDPQTLSTLNRVEGVSELAPEFFTPGECVVDGHLSAVREAVAGIPVESHSAWMNARSERFRDLLEACLRERAQDWQRFVGPSGVARQVAPPRDWTRVAADGVHRLDGETGWVTPNLLNLLADLVFGALEHEGTTVWSLAGLQMAGYVRQHHAALDQLYAAVRRTFDWPLPEEITYAVVPAAECRFAVPQSRRDALDVVVDTYERIQKHRRRRGELMRSRAEQGLTHRQAVDRLAAEQRPLYHDLREAVAASRIDYDVKDGTFPTQYDVLDGGGLYVAEWMLDRPVEDVTNAYRMVCRAH